MSSSLYVLAHHSPLPKGWSTVQVPDGLKVIRGLNGAMAAHVPKQSCDQSRIASAPRKLSCRGQEKDLQDVEKGRAALSG